MFKTIITVAAAAFITKRVAPDTYAKAVQIVDDAITITSDVATSIRGQVSAYTAEAAADAQKRLQAVDPNAVQKLRQMLDGGAQQATAPAQHRAARIRRP